MAKQIRLRPLAVVACIASTLSCSATDPNVVSGRASVVAGCPVLLRIAGVAYEPTGLPDSLAVVGLQLDVHGRVHDRPSTCMMGQGLRVTAASRAR